MDEGNEGLEIVDVQAEIDSIADPRTESIEGLSFADESQYPEGRQPVRPGDDAPVVILGQTNRVKVYAISCRGGATSSFYTADAGWGLNLRFGFFRANGARLGVSRIFTWDRAIAINDGYSWAVRGSLPAGTKQVRGFWWLSEPNGSATTYWNAANCNC
jgi:hypothetical protein